MALINYEEDQPGVAALMRRRALLGAPQPVAPVAGQSGGAVFGVYPRPSSQFSTNLNDAALQRGVQATGPSTFAPAGQPVAGPTGRLGAAEDPRSFVNPANMGVPTAVAPSAAVAPPMNVQQQGAATAPGIATPPASALPDGPGPGGMKVGDTVVDVPPAGLGAGVTTSADRIAQMGRDSQHLKDITALQRGTDAAMGMGPNNGGVIGTDPAAGASAAQKFFDEANLRNAAAKGSWSPRLGYRGDADAVKAAMVPIQNRAAMEQAQLTADTSIANTGSQQTGANTRAALGEAGANARASQVAAGQAARLGIDTQRFGLEQQEFGLKAQGARMDNQQKARIEAVQNELAAATTPAARQAAAEKLNALAGRAQAPKYSAIELGGGSVADPGTGLSVPQPKKAVIYNQADGTYQEVGGGPAGGQPALPKGMTKMVGTSGGKPVYEDASGKRYVGN